MRIKGLNLFARPSRVGTGHFSWFSTVRARLYLTFGFVAALTVVCSLVSFYDLVEIGATTNEIVSRNLPATIVSLRLAEEASSLVASSPRLISSKDDKSRSEIASRIDQQAKNLTLGIERLKELGFVNNDTIDSARSALLERLTALNRAVTDMLTVSNERRALAGSIRGAHEALLTALAPAIDDANFDLMTKSKQAGVDARLNATLESLRRLLEIQSESNLLAGLLTEASLVTDPDRLEPLRDLIAAAQRKIKANLSAIEDSAQQIKLVKLFDQLSVIGSDDGIIVLRTYELSRQHDAEIAFEAAQSEAAKLKTAVDALVEQQDRTAHDISVFAGRQITSSQIILILLSLAAVIVASFVAWLYVGRSVARRLGLLSDAMRRIADGDLSVQVHDERRDEIADMARALLFFRQATADAAAARQKEIEQGRNSESRRLLIEAAMEKFEHVVSNIVQTLDRAATTMDSSAREMAESADHNQRQALSTAAASEQATTNVETVASAAEEIARSIEHIASRVADSATIARQATTEAQAISNAVAGLSASVDEIGDVSELIRSIAAQTNLLALNATIEAARAGDAGRGFAIVAQEVKGLAAQTGKATEEITQQIKSIEQTTTSSVLTMKAIAATIMELDNLANDVSAAVRQQDSVTQEIARNASAAAKGTRDVSANISDVSTAAIKTGQVANIVLVASGDLARQSQHLRQEVEHFLAQVRVA
jgi:methyl-accepting chemotaxis protein